MYKKTIFTLMIIGWIFLFILAVSGTGNNISGYGFVEVESARFSAFILVLGLVITTTYLLIREKF